MSSSPSLAAMPIRNARYLLRDAAGAKAVARYREDGTPAYAEVIARYSKDGSRNVMTVTVFADLTPGKSCHLLDALDVPTQPDVPKEKDTPANRRIAGSEAKQSALVGHYYLMGVMETGSELLLRSDGLFDWSLSYGVVDHFRLVNAVDRFGQSVVIAVTDAADRRLDPGLGEALGVFDGDVLRSRSL